MTNLLENCRWDTSGKITYVVGVDCQVRDHWKWHEAVTSYLENTVSIFMSHPTKRVRSAGGDVDIAHPLIVQLRYWKTPKREPRPKTLNDKASNGEILRRDGYSCAYCGKHARTVDHVIPRERCRKLGLPHEGSTWGNLVAACWECNQSKKNRTPEEADMPLRFHPYVVKGLYPHVQKTVDQILKTGEGYHTEADTCAGLIKKEKKLITY